ncbi:helix-turn-helix transcriptional regulator [Streptomyces sp. HU2014]|uniref:HTH cro/C1-type domain-containing protein n=1 Tax=Streptomyces albireticuli TaxID=1940 RepID=A0A1Z2KUN9_9ACTN|nr:MULTISPECIES: helix-turn-helix transcriptional regulator [Streptomyces]ARZ65777.1 hypothetical protein SMD11_0110 [Streptomyces albireticuli]UQI45981.1 helix-turn-helix transcriptional regulator [Streptomyces sp. HU2014]UQI46067.1 helix-turn-helix transcriptional regulator [Streptomyces sp. HU2014]
MTPQEPGDPLRALRLRQGLSQAGLAGVTHSVVSRLEAGRHSPTVRSLSRPAEALGAGLVLDLTPPEPR